MRRWSRLAVVPLLMSGVLLVTAAPASATPDGTGSTHGGAVAAHAAASTAEQHQQVLRYWTKDRMLHATPIDRLVSKTRLVTRTVERGLPVTIPPTLSKLHLLPQRAGSTGEKWTGGGEVTHTAGRVFFTTQGRDASCSGNAVTSENGDVVVTAGHCVRYEGTWNDNWVFVPGYHDGKAPFGEWTARQLLTTPQWEANQDLNYDVGIGLVNTRGGDHLTEAVGGQGIAFNQPRGQEMYDFGYPAVDPYDGESLIFCSGEVFNDLLFSNDQGMKCTMNGGASGGPWFSDFDESSGTGTQGSVNSFKYTFDPSSIYGPYFGDEVQKLYETAQDS